MTAPGTPNSSHRPVLVLDFDGTVCLGDGPIWAYADGVLPHLAPDVARDIRRELQAHLEHRSPTWFADGYSAIATLAGPHVTPEVLSAAYDTSRLALEDADTDIHPPDGLAELLDRLRPAVRVLVVTNAPSTGLDSAVKRLGLSAQIDEVIPSAGKPTESAALIARLLDGAPAASLMSVGDIWANDIAPALAAGCATAFIDRAEGDPRAAHARARTIQELYPAIESWARSPLAFTAAHPAPSSPSHPTPDRSTP